MVHKWWRVMLVYFGGVIAGSLGSSLSDPATYLAGASGGVYALIAAHLANVIINFKEMTFGWVRLLGLLIFAGTDIGVALYSRYVEDEKSRTSYAAHFAGSLAGLMIVSLCHTTAFDVNKKFCVVMQETVDEIAAYTEKLTDLNLQEVESLCNLMYQLNKAHLQYESTVEILHKLNSTKDGMPAVIPLTNSMYVQGDLCNINKIILTLGSEYQMEVDKETAISHFIRKIQRVRGKIGTTQKILAAKILEREQLKKAAAEKYYEENKKNEMEPFPALLTG
ncbi:Rhomboid-related protein 2 like protein [Argiope bruennichi]|uniref:Rhomboid-related protein 2 like protein n=1 Tax=Argiope bruennichi TaxID=94029 RepID=A0A8T0E9D3_ARGBR|nr:Rhomboid-related protein 2 like protein [Argiope bruennichi]